MTLKQAFFILRHGSAEGIHKYLEAVKVIEDDYNRQKAEIEELEAEIDKQYEQAKADILGNMADGGTSCHWCIDQHRAKAVKEFAERLKEELFKITVIRDIHDEEEMDMDSNEVWSKINELVKELTEGEKQ